MKRLFKWLMAIPNYIASKRWYVAIPMVLAIVALLAFIGNRISLIWAFWDEDPDRGATIVQTDVYGDVARTIKFLPQNWTASQTLWFDGTTQGSDLLPYDFFLVLEQPNGKLFRDNENMNNRYRYLVRKPTFSNPDGLPVGFVKDNYDHKEFLGYTCAACHTAQINYKGTGFRIDGAPAMADMDTFLDDLGEALLNAQRPSVQPRFVKNVLALGNYGSEQDVINDLKIYALRLYAYRVINKSPTTYGFARLDAFGRIYNQVLEYVVTVEDIQDALNQLAFEGKISGAEAAAARKAAKLNERGQYSVLTAADRDSIMEALAITLKEKKFLRLRDKIFNRPSAPVSYPFLWDIPQHDYVQWNGIAANASLGPVGRNVGEVIGVFGTMNWTRSDHWTVAGVFSGQGLFNGHPMNYASSVNVHNLTMIEDQLGDLWAPQWPQDFGPIQEKHRARGEELFNRHCAACHATIDPRDSRRRIVAHMSALDHVGTDPKMAQNGAGYTGYSGIVRNEYVAVGPGQVLLDRKAAVAAMLIKTTTGVVATPDADKGPIQRFIEWLSDIVTALRHNDIDVSMKAGDYHPDTTDKPLSSVLAYKGRALDGIWATAPYLHNGSVPSLYDLLLPAKAEAGDPPGMEYRPAKFMVGSREFDTCKVGFNDVGPNNLAFSDPCHRPDTKPVPYDGFLFLTDIPGNSNAGHEYGTRPVYKTDDKGNKILVTPALTLQDRLDLVEYLKSL